MVIGVDVADPNALQARNDMVRAGSPIAAAQLPVGTLPTVQQHAAMCKHVQIGRRHIAILGRHCCARPQEQDLQRLPPRLQQGQTLKRYLQLVFFGSPKKI